MSDITAEVAERIETIRLALKGARGCALDAGEAGLDAELGRAIDSLDALAVPFTVVPSSWWSWSVDAAGDYVQMGHTLPCGHKIAATSRTSDRQLRRNYSRMEARHAGHPIPGEVVS